MRKIVVKFNKSKDIESLKKIMKNVYASNSDHLPDIAKFHLGEKVFIPNQVEKAELHIMGLLRDNDKRGIINKKQSRFSNVIKSSNAGEFRRISK